MTAHSLAGRHIVVTGAASGIGRAVVQATTEAGATVTALDLVDGPGVRALDVTKESDWRELAAALPDRVDGLVNCAGTTYRARLGDVTPEALQAVHDTNVLGPLLAIQALTPRMSSGASIVTVGSLAALQAHYPVAYTTSKWAARGLTHAAALELGRRGIRVNAVHPGFIDTPMTASAPPEFREAAITGTSLGRAGAADEVASVIVFLLSDASSYVTGAEIPVDGGASSQAGAKLVSDALLPTYTPPTQATTPKDT